MKLSAVKNLIKSLRGKGANLDPTLEQINALNSLTSLACDVSPLGQLSAVELSNFFLSPEIKSIWESVSPLVSSLNLPEMTGGVNPGDQRAIFYLICALQPQSILEVGTHIGCSTVHIALAAQALSQNIPHITFKTVDIRDVNDPIQQPWKEFNAQYSPGQLIEKIAAQSLTQFEVSSSLEYFQNHPQEKFDFIFLDGLHDAYMVYQEIPVALEHLHPRGYILLHDYFPHRQPLWEGYPPLPGPYLAVKRFQDEGVALDVIPLGELPWATKLGTNITSLALLVHNEHGGI